MDKGYDSEEIHRQIREDLHAESIIPIRSWNNEAVSGKYRQEMASQFDNEKYGRRQLVENRFSVLKRKFSGDLKARRFLIQMKEITTKMIVCNIHTFLQFLIVELFYRAVFLILCLHSAKICLFHSFCIPGKYSSQFLFYGFEVSFPLFKRWGINKNVNCFFK
jgi:hypothetical protein